jgi:hypothetical protein
MEHTLRQYGPDMSARSPIIERDLGRAGRSTSRRTLRVFLTVIFIMVILGASSFVLPKVTRGAQNTWTFLVYLNGDSDLEHVAIQDFLEMAAAGSTPNVNIVVQFDRSPGYNVGQGYDSSYGNWTTCKRFHITSGMTPIDSNAVSDIGEVDMGNPDVLADFIDWGVTNYAATNYALIVWDHGGSWRGVSWDYSSSNDYLTMSELATALGRAQASDGGIVLDILGFDACSMSSIEVACQVSPYARYLVASEIYVPDDGFEYTSPLSALAANPDMSTFELSNEILDSYAKYYLSLTGTPNWDELNESFTLSVVDLGLVDQLAVAVDALATELEDNIGLWVNHIALARNMTESYSAAWVNDGIDIYNFAENLRNITSNTTIDDLAEGVMVAVEASVLNETHGTNPDNCLIPVNHTHGLSMYFYPPMGWRDTSYSLQGMNFTNDTAWDELLGLYQSELALGNPTVMDFSPQASDAPLDSEIVATFSEPMNTASLATSFSIVPYVSGTLQTDPSALTFSPDAGGLQPGTTYTVTISVNATDQQGHNLQQDFAWQFTTATEIPEFPSGVLPALMLLALVLAISRRKRD